MTRLPLVITALVAVALLAGCGESPSASDAPLTTASTACTREVDIHGTISQLVPGRDGAQLVVEAERASGAEITGPVLIEVRTSGNTPTEVWVNTGTGPLSAFSDGDRVSLVAQAPCGSIDTGTALRATLLSTPAIAD